MSLRVKFGLLIVLIFGLVTVAMSLLQVHWVRTLVFEHTEARMAQNIHAAWNVLGSRQRLLEAHVSALAELGELEEYREVDAGRIQEEERVDVDVGVGLRLPRLRLPGGDPRQVVGVVEEVEGR